MPKKAKKAQKRPKKAPPSHTTGIVVDIIGIEDTSQGGICDDGKTACGSLLVADLLVWFCEVQVVINGVEETGLAVYLISEGIDRCQVGFLRRFLVKHKKKYDGRLAQITDILGSESESPSDRQKYHCNNGYCHAVLRETVPVSQHSSSGEDEEEEAPQKKQQITVDSKEDCYYSITITITIHSSSSSMTSLSSMYHHQ